MRCQTCRDKCREVHADVNDVLFVFEKTGRVERHWGHLGGWTDWDNTGRLLGGSQRSLPTGPAMLRKTPELPIILNRCSVILILQKTPNRELGSRSASLTPWSSKVIHQECITKCGNAYKDIVGWRDTSDSALFDLGIPRRVGILGQI